MRWGRERGAECVTSVARPLAPWEIVYFTFIFVKLTFNLLKLAFLAYGQGGWKLALSAYG